MFIQNINLGQIQNFGENPKFWSQINILTEI